MNKTLRVVGASLVAAGLTFGAASPSGAEPAATIDDITLEECDIVVTFTVGDAGDYYVEVWDDGEQIGDVAVTAEEGATVQGRYTITSAVKQSASGLGIEITGVEGQSFDGIDPYNGADDIIDFCASQDTSSPTTAPPVVDEPEVEPELVDNTPPVVAPAATPVVADPVYTG